LYLHRTLVIIGIMQTRVYYNPHMGTTRTRVNVNAALGRVPKTEPL